MKDFFLRVAGCEFIQMNRRSASFECWVYHFELNNPLSASISYSNGSMKREICKLNLKTCKKKSLNAVWTIFAKGLKQPLPLCNRTEYGDDSVFVPLPLSDFHFETNVILTLPPRNIGHYLTVAEVSNCRLDSHRNFARVKTPFLKSFKK